MARQLDSGGIAPLKGKENHMQETKAGKYTMLVTHVDMWRIFQTVEERIGAVCEGEILGSEETMWLALEGSGW